MKTADDDDCDDGNHVKLFFYSSIHIFCVLLFQLRPKNDPTHSHEWIIGIMKIIFRLFFTFFSSASFIKSQNVDLITDHVEKIVENEISLCVGLCWWWCDYCMHAFFFYNFLELASKFTFIKAKIWTMNDNNENAKKFKI